MSTCSKRAGMPRIPEGFSNESAAQHPRFRLLLGPGAQCELDPGHGDGTPEHDRRRRHRSGNLVWWDPPLLLVGGKPVDPEPQP